jgi:hypothetical protein
MLTSFVLEEYNESMKKKKLKKSQTLDDKVDALTETVETLAMSVAKGFDRIDSQFEAVEKRFDGIDKRLDDIDYRLGKIESNHERRLDILEDKMAVIKTYFEKTLKGEVLNLSRLK